MTSTKKHPGEGIARALGIRSLSSYVPANTPPARQVQGALNTAIDYAARGYAVFPCWPQSKAPACRRGFHDATTNPATIRRWWLATDYNIGIATGIASGVWVLDIDGDAGATAMAALEARHGPLPATLISTTSNGCHLWFRYTSPVPCSADQIAHGLDVRGDGGYVLAPPSVHPDGPTYRWTNNRPLAVASEWLVRLTRRPPPKPITSKIPPSPARPSRTDAYARAALEDEIAALASTPPGGRNHALNRAAFCLYQLVAAGLLDAAVVRNRLREAATLNGLMSDPQDGPRSVERTIASGAHAGLQHPRNRRGAS
jgi:hypothetical protein